MYAWKTLLAECNGSKHGELVKRARRKSLGVTTLLAQHGCYWQSKHIFSHTKHRGNEAADALAKRARESGRTGEAYERYRGREHAVNLHPHLSQGSDEEGEHLCSPPDYGMRSYERYEQVERVGVNIEDRDGDQVTPFSSPSAA